MAEPTYETRECDCRYEVVEPGKAWKIRHQDRCETHRRQREVELDAEGAVDMMVDDCKYQGHEKEVGSKLLQTISTSSLSSRLSSRRMSDD